MTRREGHRPGALTRAGCGCGYGFARVVNLADRQMKLVDSRLYLRTVFLSNPSLGSLIRNADGQFTVVERAEGSARNPILVRALAELSSQRALDPIPSVST